ncbi:hypothetical protein KZZ04_20270, partial [Pseudoalteromonas sp. CR1]|uniref:hypothetical protein n=1 Tax=Pseudoalteromonas sp. CR1 TaxID=2861964 RepID=UPI001C5E5719
MQITYRKLPFGLVYGLEVILPIECEISSLKIFFKLLPETFSKEERLLYLSFLYERHHEVIIANESNQKCIKNQYDKKI